MNTNIRLSEYWTVLKNRLADASMLVRLMSTAEDTHIHLVTERPAAASGPEDRPWHRLIIVPTSPIDVAVELPGETRKLAFLLRAEANNISIPGKYDASISLEAIQSKAYELIDGWAPAFNAMNRVKIALDHFRWIPTQPLPLYDEVDGLWYNSAEYRTEAVAP
jgi:hypothetical protein